jgi:CDP-diacylglycerol--glycerol-3-phosphate 3-phosphatidyltransferase
VNAANWLSLSRLLSTAPILVLMYQPGRPATWGAFVLFVLAMLTDPFDGLLARRDPGRSPLGNYLDPVADKVLLMSLFIGLADRDVVAAWMVVVLVAREFVVNGVRAAGAVQGRTVGANWMGKTKTFFQTVAIGAGLLGLALGKAGVAGGVLLQVAWWTTLGVTVLAAVFAGVFVYWNRWLFARGGGPATR